jgi:choline dehydrogenase-like flavoprotein
MAFSHGPCGGADGQSWPMARIHDRRDFAIVGAGAAGALLAARLAEAGRSVVLLEAGPDWQLADLTSSQIWARRLKWGGAPVEQTGPDRVGHNFGTGWGTGGAAIHHYGFWPRLRPEDFRLRSETGQGRDWPIAYDDLAPHYDRVQAEVGISGDAATEPGRPAGAPYPMPPLKTFAQAALLTRGFEALGMSVGPAPLAINSQWFGDRPPCQYDGWCDAGCPIRALANPQSTYLPRAIAAGAEIRNRAMVTRVERGANGPALHYRDSAGKAHVQPAGRVILAGAPVQNARLLLASADGGLGNRSGQLGRGFAAHLLANGHALFAEPTDCHLGVSAGSAISLDDYGKRRSDSPTGSPTGSIAWGIAPAMKPNDLLGLANTRADLHGAALHAFLARAARHLGTVNGIVESIPDPANRIELGSARDAHGMPTARIVHRVPTDARRLWELANSRARALLAAAGAQEAWTLLMPAYAHLSGGTVMGRDPATSVTDHSGRLHDAPDLFVAGAGLFPSIGALSPTFTVLALADRTARTLLQEA